MSEKLYQSEAWLDQRLEVRQSSIDKSGIFTKEPIKAGEIVIVWGGTLMSGADIQVGKYRPRSAAEIGENLYLAGRIEDPEEDPDENLNHSCDPNLWMGDEVTLIAKRDIKSGEEVTADYAMWVSRPAWKMVCNCGSAVCRGIITGNDWTLSELQTKYKGHLSPYLNTRIENLKK